jgi:hypothetical protein
MTLIKIGSKVKIIQYNKDPSMNGRIGIVKKLGVHPDTTCIVKVGDGLLKIRGLKNLKLFETKKCNIDLEDMSTNEVLSEILKILEIMNNKIYKKIDAKFFYNCFIRMYIINN